MIGVVRVRLRLHALRESMEEYLRNRRQTCLKNLFVNLCLEYNFKSCMAFIRIVAQLVHLLVVGVRFMALLSIVWQRICDVTKVTHSC